MRFSTRAASAGVGVFGLIGVAHATDMTGAEIKAFYSGNTIYLETTAASSSGKAGQGVIYWNADGSAIYKTPTGATWTGKWEIKGNTNCPVWKELPDATYCTFVDKTGDVTTIIDATSRKVRAKIVKTAPGNAEKLVP